MKTLFFVLLILLIVALSYMLGFCDGYMFSIADIISIEEIPNAVH